MNVFIIPSWYPSAAFPSTGIFFREQAFLTATCRPDIKVGVSLWGSHEPSLWMKATRPLDCAVKMISKPAFKSKDVVQDANLAEFFTPAFTWTRKWMQGNLRGIIAANEENLRRYILYFGQPDLLHAHVAYPGGAIAMALAAKYRIPYMITEHMSPFPMPSFRRDFRKTVLPPLRQADRVLVVSQSLADQLAKFQVPSQVVSNFIDDSFFTPGTPESDPFTLVAVGRLEAQKNYPLLLATLQKLTSADIHLKILGDGVLKKSLQTLASKYQVAHKISWLGECDRTTVAAELKTARLFINTSDHENQPVAILEALASGLPVVTTAWRGAEELVTPHVGRVIKVPDPQEIANSIEGIKAEQVWSKAEIRRQFEKRFGTRDQVTNLVTIYHSLLS